MLDFVQCEEGRPSWCRNSSLLLTCECFHPSHVFSAHWMKVWGQRRNQREGRPAFPPLEKIYNRRKAGLSSLFHHGCGIALVITVADLSNSYELYLMRL